MNMTVKEIIDKLGEYNPEAFFNIVVNGLSRPFKVCYGSSEGVTKANCDVVDLMIDDICDEVNRNEI